jgi:hypothetical protein
LLKDFGERRNGRKFPRKPPKIAAIIRSHPVTLAAETIGGRLGPTP